MKGWQNSDLSIIQSVAMNTNDADVNEYLTLVLMRHAKSDWSDGSLSDHDRPLNKRGRQDSPKMAQWLSQIDRVPDLILCSSAARTRETTDLLCNQWLSPPTKSISDSLYLASPDAIMYTLANEGGNAKCLMVLAHNPGMGQLVSVLSNQAIEMPTAAAAVFQVKADSWQAVGSSAQYTLLEFMRPKVLELQ